MVNMSLDRNQHSKVKELLCCWVAGQFCVLVPKRRGSGFLRVPYGHHFDEGLDDIASTVSCDVFGLDGMLEFECGGSTYHDQVARERFFKQVVPRLETHYGVLAREVSQSEFWRYHPLTKMSSGAGEFVEIQNLKKMLAAPTFDDLTVVRMARRDLDTGDIDAALARLRVDADKIRMLDKQLYALLVPG
ncbi:MULTISPECIES: hypothetical protein [Herbaspirillum]|uniref:Uncharacterized protein n=2 Tax=Herbaspirillum huttiense TaxID=863372 RepID=A0AAJ2LU56_9BURK|nr:MULTISPECIES: hypothetical protein [Herbaspirillum]MDR9839672.1 hypothetical protein [Herbaspirillum huttiense]